MKTLWWCESVGSQLIVYARSECGMRLTKLAIHRYVWENARYQKEHLEYVIRQLQAKLQ